MKRLALFAATGRVGGELLRQALAAGFDVTVVVRNPDRLPADFSGRVVTADLTTAAPEGLVDALHEVDAVLSAAGPAGRGSTPVAAPATARIVAAMAAAQVRRLVVVSASPVGPVGTPNRPGSGRPDPGDDAVMRYLLGPVIRRLLPGVYRDLALMEDLLAAEDLDWTAVRPPQLTDGPLTTTYRTAVDRNLPRGRKISRADLGHFMIDILDRTETYRHTVGIAT